MKDRDKERKNPGGLELEIEAQMRAEIRKKTCLKLDFKKERFIIGSFSYLRRKSNFR